MADCTCADWKENIGKVNAPTQLAVARSGGRYGHYDGKVFVYCPWCAQRLGELPINADQEQCGWQTAPFGRAELVRCQFVKGHETPHSYE